MKALVTGATGLIGTALVAELERRGVEVSTWRRGVEALAKASADADVIYHLGWQTSSEVADESPVTDYAANIMPLHFLTKAAGPRVVFASSDSAANPVNTYDRHKAEGERLVEAAGGRVVRFPHVFGPGPLPKHGYRATLNRLIAERARQKLPVEWSGPYKAQTFMYVDDAVRELTFGSVQLSEDGGARPTMFWPDAVAVINAVARGGVPAGAFERDVLKTLDYWRGKTP